MKDEPLEVVALDSYSGHDFAVYFSDDTYATVTASRLAECFPERTPILVPEDVETLEGGKEKEAEGEPEQEG